MGMAESRRVEDESAELEDLRFDWGDAYDIEIGADDTGCTARRRDGKGATLADPHPEGLRRLIRADYAAMRVPGDLP